MPDIEEQEEQEELEQTVEEAEEVETEEDEEEPVKTTQNSQAQALHDLLNNPATAKSTLQMIASNLGLTVSETKTEEGQAAIKDVIKLALGDDLAFLGDKLGPLGDALEKMVNDRISKAELKQNERYLAQESARYTSIIDSTIKDLNAETKNEFNAHLPAINKLMEDMPIGKQTPDQYLRRLFNIAKSEADGRVKKATPEKAIREARKTTLAGTGNTERIKEGSSRNPTHRESVLQAIKSLSKK